MVTVANPVSREVVRFELLTGRAESTIKPVDIRAKVSGFLKKVYFKPGSEVDINAPLFDIDPASYDAENAVAEAQIALASG